MKKSNYIGSEFKRMIGKRSVLISVVAVLLVPLLYAMIMLSPKWGPQDNLDNIPVAVVNNDTGAEQDGEIIHIGNELIENLEGNPTLGWDFVSAEAADKGMDDMKYYMKIEVPEDFSEKAISVMDDKPQKPDLKFVQNEGLHYMAATVTDTAIETIKGQLSAQMTETYIETVFDQVGESAEGFAEAAAGAKEINEGTGTAKDGTEEMKFSLIEKTPDISELAAGAKELDDGTGELLGNLTEKAPDISELAAGAKELDAGTGELLGNLNEKAPDISELAAGAKELNAGTGEILDNLNKKSSDIQELADGAKEVNDGTDLLLETLNEKSPDITELSEGASELSDGASALKEGSGQLADGANALRNGLKVGSEFNAGLTELDGDFSELTNGVLEAQKGVNDTIDSMFALEGSLEMLSNLNKEDPLYDVILEQTLSQLRDGLYGDDGADSKRESFEELAAGAQRAENGISKLKAGLDEKLVPGSNDLAKGANELNSKVPKLQEGAQDIAKGTQTVRSGWTELQENVAVLNDGTQQVADGNQTVKSGWNDLQDGATELHAGSTQVADGNQTVKSGWNDLQDGATELSAGSSQVADGNQTVKSGWNDLQDGATELNAGSSQISDGNQTVKSGWADLTDGATQLNDGSSQISDGTLTVKEGWATLTDGVTQLDDGVLQLKDGSGELHEGLADGAETAGAVDPQEDNIAMFASPVQLDGEVINTFQFYRDANAPYIITLALFVGVLAMSFVVPFRRPEILPTSGITWFTGKVLKLATLATAQALIISLYSLLVLQIQVQSSLMFVLFSIWVSLTFLMIVMFLVVLGGNIGRFIALAFAVLQLSTTGSALPIHMLPEGLRNLSTFLPFTYSIDGFKNIVTLGSTSTIWSNVGVLFIYLALFGILSAVVFLVRYRKVSEEMEQEDVSDESTI